MLVFCSVLLDIIFRFYIMLKNKYFWYIYCANAFFFWFSVTQTCFRFSIKFRFLGNCTCNEGYAGSDCSFDLLGPPTISHISDFGFCDKSKEACDEITMFGKYFIENMNTNCFMTRNTVITRLNYI